MISDRKSFYLFFGILCLAGYFWLFYNLVSNWLTGYPPIGVCLFRHITTIPCPSCGSTNAALLFFRGEILKALYSNPIGILLAAGMIIIPFWIIFDLLSKKNTLLLFFRKSENIIKRRCVASLGVVLIISIWIWKILMTF
jgi:hypothetical protein